ncbi:MAG: DUF2071 domain-containing protein [Flavobacteriales bacterium]|nr:MAG: DUF2071 domain-containing protein [Flavobacteriales bacterium]
MFEVLKNHPFGVVADLERTVVLAFAAPAEELAALLPSFLEPDTFNERWGFVAMAAVRTRDLRPSGFPKWCGQDFWLIGYRIFVRYPNAVGKRLRGLYILGSETDRRLMAVLGNRFTHYGYRYKPMTAALGPHGISLRAKDGSTAVVVKDDGAAVALPSDSVFADWIEARRFVGPLPFTFSHNVRKDHVLIVEGSRTNWHPRPVSVVEHRCDFITNLRLSELRLSNAFTIDRVPYHWKPGILESLER